MSKITCGNLEDEKKRRKLDKPDSAPWFNNSWIQLQSLHYLMWMVLHLCDPWSIEYIEECGS